MEAFVKLIWNAKNSKFLTFYNKFLLLKKILKLQEAKIKNDLYGLRVEKTVYRKLKQFFLGFFQMLPELRPTKRTI